MSTSGLTSFVLPAIVLDIAILADRDANSASEGGLLTRPEVLAGGKSADRHLEVVARRNRRE
jgi:hypothetical protein